MATTSDISKGAFFRYNNELVTVLDYDHITPGKGNAIYSVKCRNVDTGKQSEIRFRSGEQIDFIRNSELSHRALGKMFNVSHANIGYIKRNATWQ